MLSEEVSVKLTFSLKENLKLKKYEEDYCTNRFF